ncbi:MAG: SDR family NAD(P)-dependent oxidoreductase [Acidimicrobiaceae bacterium]|nr:SDR family NAD(P)-dependent oxidoreductase [Acidimicrobiaceae bacterium]MDE0607190.1 SDR family NAD(P)-dependent oxidoreductase [Acidimicrobiaceae bacterium]
MTETPIRTGVILGASGAIGEAVCRQLAPDWNLAGVSRRGLSDELLGIGVADLRVDITEPDAGHRIEAWLDAAGWSCDALVATSGVHEVALLTEYEMESIEAMLAVNFLGPLAVTRALLPAMLSRRQGSIVWVGSVRADLGDPGQVVYAATKGAMNSAARSLAREVGRRKVRVNIVSPGVVTSAMTDALAHSWQESLTKRNPLGRMADPEEVAAVICWLAGPESSYVTGAIVNVDCGESAAVLKTPVV